MQISVPTLIRRLIAGVVLGLGIYWCLSDWIRDAELLGGLSYLISAITVSVLIYLGFEIWSKGRGARVAFGLAILVLSLASFLFETLSQNKADAADEVQAGRILSDFSTRQGLASDASYAASSLAEHYISAGACPLKTVGRFSYYVTSAMFALVEPETAVVVRVLYGKPRPAADRCAEAMSALRAQESSIVDRYLTVEHPAQ